MVARIKPCDGVTRCRTPWLRPRRPSAKARRRHSRAIAKGTISAACDDATGAFLINSAELPRIFPRPPRRRPRCCMKQGRTDRTAEILGLPTPEIEWYCADTSVAGGFRQRRCGAVNTLPGRAASRDSRAVVADAGSALSLPPTGTPARCRSSRCIHRRCRPGSAWRCSEADRAISPRGRARSCAPGPRPVRYR